MPPAELSGPGWTDAIVETLLDKKASLEKLIWSYEKMEQSATRWGAGLAIISAIISGMVGVEGTVSSFKDACEPKSAMDYIATALSFAAMVILAFSATWKFGEVQASSKAVHVRLRELANRIDLELLKAPRSRQSPHEFTKDILETMSAVKQTAPVIYKSIQKSADRKFRNKTHSRHSVSENDIALAISGLQLREAIGAGRD